MANQTSEPIANRGTPIPVVSVTGPDESTPATPLSEPQTPTKRNASRHAGKLRDKLESLGDHIGRPESPSAMSDRLFGMLLSQVFPQDTSETPVKDRPSRKHANRPNFSLPVMSSNFRRFNARIGVAFVFQNRLIRLFNWLIPAQTLSFLAVYTFVCLDPTLLAVLPIAMCIFFIMVPAFLARHPPPPTYRPTDLYPLSDGPPLAPAHSIKPAPELSKDFFRNMRDLQNSMEDFSQLHDKLIDFLAPPTNFSNEALSSIIFILLLFTSCLLFISAHLLPWRFIFLVLGWTATCLGHPTIQELLVTTKADDMLRDQESKSRFFLLRLSNSEVFLSSAPETREVEIFELQYHPLHDETAEYEAFLFSPSPYAPLSPSRIAGDRPRGTPFFEDVQPPKGWRWSDKKWTLDLLSREWVEERCVTGVEVEVEGERWVTDIQYPDAVDDVVSSKKGKKKAERIVRTWEESNGMSGRGEWRRRRWVRGVERIPVSGGGDG